LNGARPLSPPGAAASSGAGLRLVITAVVAGGSALARDPAGRVVFVDGALPGETVTARITEERRDYARATVVDVLAPSPDRVVPPCPALAAGCGGCTWQHIAPHAQARLKAGIVTDALRRIGHLPDPPQPELVPLAGPGGRTTARLAVSPGGRAGYRPRRGPGGSVETESCRAAHPLVEELIVSGRYPGASEVLLRVGVASGERLARVTPQGASRNVELPIDVAVVGEGTERAWVHERIAGRDFRISDESFFQPGPAAAEALVDAVATALVDGLASGGHLVDAYAGVGLFASVMGSRLSVRVTAVENNRHAVADARRNLADLDARVVATDVRRWRRRRGDPPVDAMVADPPRSGLGPHGVAAVVAAQAPRLVLVSCDPAALARDAGLLQAAGYRLATVAVVDTFPDTFHVETVSRFDTRPSIG
jgi:23S rRNA (uracil1939-C5)-methyltransferase